jgi:predicted porin
MPTTAWPAGLQDEGQFGAAYVYSTFNYRHGHIHGLEFSADYDNGPFSAYFNAAYNRAMGKQVMTGAYNFDPDALAYVADHWIHLDHDQKFTSSGGVSYHFSDGTRLGADYLFGSGLRTDTDTVPNGGELPSYLQLNLSAGHDFDIDGHTLHAQLAVVNALDRSYQLRDGGGIGVFAPQWGRAAAPISPCSRISDRNSRRATRRATDTPAVPRQDDTGRSNRVALRASGAHEGQRPTGPDTLYRRPSSSATHSLLMRCRSSRRRHRTPAPGHSDGSTERPNSGSTHPAPRRR